MNDERKLSANDLNYNTKTVRVAANFFSIYTKNIRCISSETVFKSLFRCKFYDSPRFHQIVPTTFPFSSVFSAFLSRAWTLLGVEVCIPARKVRNY